MSKRLLIPAVVLVALLAGTVSALAQRAGPREEDICTVPSGTLPFDTVAIGVIEKPEETTSGSDTYTLKGPDGHSSDVQSNVVDLGDYVGQRVAVYIASAPGNGEPLRNVVRVGPPPAGSNPESGELAGATCDQAVGPAETAVSETTGDSTSNSGKTMAEEGKLPASNAHRSRQWPL